MGTSPWPLSSSRGFSVLQVVIDRLSLLFVRILRLAATPLQEALAGALCVLSTIRAMPARWGNLARQPYPRSCGRI